MTETKPHSSPDLTRGGVLAGILLSIGCLWLSRLASHHLLGSDFLDGWGRALWSLPQWLVVVPLWLILRKEGRHKTANGLLLMSFAGMALNAAELVLLDIALRAIP